MRSYTKNEIIRGIRGKDNHIIVWLYDQILPELERYVSNHGGSLHDAKDIFQDTLLIVFDKIRHKAFEPNINIPEYIFGTCKNMWADRFKKNLRNLNFEKTEEKSPHLPKQMFIDPEPQVDTKEIRRALFLRHINSLGEECRKILRLVYEGIPWQDISRIMGFADQKTAYNKKTYCLTKLIRKIKKDPDNPFYKREE